VVPQGGGGGRVGGVERLDGQLLDGLVGAVETHHDRARWGWELYPTGPEAGPPVAVGVDFAVLAPDGRLREVTGFFEQPKQAAA